MTRAAIYARMSTDGGTPVKEEKPSKRRNQGQIKQRGERTFLVCWYLGRDATGKRKYGAETVHGTKRQAQKVLRDKLGRRDKGLAAPSPSSIPLVRDFIETWKASQSAARLRDRTRRDYLDILKRHVTPKLGHLRLDQVHTAEIEESVVGPIVSKGHHRTARLAVCALSRLYRAALKDRTLGLIGNPCLGVEVATKHRAGVQPFTADERRAFRTAIKGTDHEALWLLMMLTGLGPGEALALGWEHLDLDAGTLRVQRTLDTKAGELVNDTKRPTRKRTVPLVPELRGVLRERWLAAGRPPAGLVFADQLGQPLDLHNLRARHFKPAVEAAKIKRRVRIYDLRHGFATAALEAGADVKTVSELMGHAGTRTTLDVYSHVTDERKREAAKRIGDALLRS
jgi:integrase